MEILTRDYVDTKYGITLTDNEWAVVQEEMADEPHEDSIAVGLTTFEAVLDEVINNLDYFVAEYAYLDNVINPNSN